VLIGDIGSDVEAARAAGAHGVLVPTAETRVDEIVSAERVARDLVEATDAVLAGRW
jgi:beta-phosphoglucomutase-like phosphatase (HAD superfamily)